MVRSHLRYTVTDRAGNAIQNATVTAYLTGTSTLVADLYTTATGGSPVASAVMTSNDQGEVEAWLATPKTVDLQVADTTHTAYYSGQTGELLTWDAFSETVEVLPAPENIGLLDGTQGWSGSNTYVGTTTVSDKTSATNVALRSTTADATIWCSTVGNDSNDGLSPGSPKLTLAAAVAAIPASGGIVRLAGGTFAWTSTITLPVNTTIQGVSGAAYNAAGAATGTTLSYTGSGYAFLIQVMYPSLRDLRIVTNSPALGVFEIKDIGGTDHGRFQNLELYGWSTGDSTIAVYFHGQVGCACESVFSNVNISNFQTGIKMSGNANANHFEMIWMGNIGGWALDLSNDGVDTTGGAVNTFVQVLTGTTNGVRTGTGADRNVFILVNQDGLTGTGLSDAGANNIYIGGSWVATSFAASATASFFNCQGLPTGFVNRVNDLTIAATTGVSSVTLGKSGATNGVINGPENLYINIDSDNTQTGTSLVVGTNRAVDSGGTQLLSITDAGVWTLLDGSTLNVGTTTGSKIGTATSQKLGFYNATPIVQPTSTTDLRTALINLGLYATGGASPLNLNGGLLTAAGGVIVAASSGVSSIQVGAGGATNGVVHSPENISFNIDSDNTQTTCTFKVKKDSALDTGGTDLLSITEAGAWTVFDGSTMAIGTTTGLKIGTATTQKVGFYNATPVVQPSAYTQTYATASKTHSALTSADLTGISSSTTGSALVEPDAVYVQATWQQNMRRIQDQFVALRADLTNAKQVLNSTVDDLQALGLVA